MKALSSSLVQTWLLVLLIVFGCAHNSPVADGRALASRGPLRPIDLAPDITENIGREALQKIGYEEIIKLAEEAGFVAYKSDVSIQLVRYGPAVATGFVRVFSRYAAAAAVTAQADSPLPGPADVAAVGVLVMGLVDAGLLDGYLLKSVGELLSATGAAILPVPATTNVPGDRSDCRAQLTKCLGTSASRGRRGSGSHPGQSICVDCLQQCIAQGIWPDKTPDDKDCQWWDGR